MTSTRHPINSSLLSLFDDMKVFVDGEISGEGFEYRFVNGNSNVLLPQKEDGSYLGYEAYQQIFYAVEDYVDDPALRDGPEDLDEDGLRTAVTTAREALWNALTSAGYEVPDYVYP